MTNQQIKTLATFTNKMYMVVAGMAWVDGYGFSITEKFLFEVWVKYRDIDRSAWNHKKETQYISDRIKIEFAILNQPVEQALTLLSESIIKLEL